MKKKILVIFVTITVLASLFAVCVSSYDSENDPIVTLSYLTDVFMPTLKEDIFSSISDMLGTEPKSQKTDVTYAVVELLKGEKIIAKSSLEVILRPGGEAKVVAPDETLGLSDITSGIELYNGDSLIVNHYTIVPRPDGREILATSEKAFLMVRGEFEIEQ